MRKFIAFFSLLAMLCIPSQLSAQVDRATLVGTVRDASGAVVSGAEVTAIAVETNTKTVAKTDAEGSYVITPLKIGRYSVSVEAAGFKSQVRPNVVLDVQDRVRIDFSLTVGSISERVEVTGETPLLQPETSSLGQVIESRQITDMPLEGRDYVSLVSLTAGIAKVTEGSNINGATSPTNGNAGGNFVANGTRGNLNNFMLDGIDNNSNDNAGTVLYTNVDAIEEFKVQTSTYSAEFGRSGGAVVNAAIKSGSNQFHGNVFEFLRNQALDARGFFEDPTVAKAPFKQNQFGFTLGGPIKKDKTFLFGDYEGARVRSATTNTTTVPISANERGGDFSAILGSQILDQNNNPVFDALDRPEFTNEIFDPNTTRTVGGVGGPIVRDGFGFDAITGQPTAQANIIPANRLDSIGQNYAALYPDPTVAFDPSNDKTRANNYTVNSPGSSTLDHMDVRVDHNVSSAVQLFGRFSISRWNRFQAPVFTGIADGGNYGTGNYVESTRGAAIGYIHTLSSTLVNELRIGFNRRHYVDNTPSYGQNLPPAGLLIPGSPDNPLINGLTRLAPNGFQRLGEPLYTPTRSTSQEFQLSDTLNIVRRKHTIRTGVQLRASQFNLFQIGQPRGSANFSGQFTQLDPGDANGTGSGLADMLLGLAISAKISSLTYFGNRQHSYGGFVNDDYKISSKLTLNLGLRYDYVTPAYEAHNHQSNFDFKTKQIIVAGQNGNSRGLTQGDKLDFSPRIGFAYSPFHDAKTVIRGAYGRFFNSEEIRTGDPLQLAYNVPFFFEPSLISNGDTVKFTLATGFPSLDPIKAPFPGVTSVDARLHSPVFDEWNLNIQRELPGKILLETAYVGSKGTHLQVLVDRNQIIPTPSANVEQIQRPYPEFGSFTSIENHGNSTYHSVQLKAEKHLSNGLFFLSAFTYGKSINDQPEICCNSPWPQNSYNLKSEKGLSDFDNRRHWVTSLDYELPVGHGKRFMHDSRALDLAFGGWHVGAIVSLRSGFPFTPQIDFDPSNTFSQGLQRADRLGNGNLPPSKRTPDLWFDTSQFPSPTGLNFGNAGKNILDGPGAKTADLSLRKAFTFRERFHVDFRTEFFNAFNHPVFSQPDAFITDGPGAVGVITSTVISQRTLQFGLKFSF
jgi:hypothetical protein